MRQMNVEMRITSPAAPLQIEGTVDGVPFYFRSRWEEWEFAAGDDPVEIAIDRGTRGGFYRSEGCADGGGAVAASWMTPERAKRIVRRCAAEFIRIRRGSSEPAS